MLKAHDWPGNIRELQNFIERAVVFSPESVLRLPLMDLKQMTKQPSAVGLAHAGRCRARAHSGCAEANRWADRGTARRCVAAGIAAHHVGLQDAETGNRSAPHRSGPGPPSMTRRCSRAPHPAALGSDDSNLSRPSERVRFSWWFKWFDS